MDISFLASGMIMRDLGVAIARGDPLPVRAIGGNAEPDRGQTELVGAFLFGVSCLCS